MKKITALLIALVMTLSIGALTALAETYVTGIYEITVNDPDPNERYLNVRAGLPNSGNYSTIWGQVWNGEKVEVIEVVNTDWGKIIFEGKEGYIRLKSYTTFVSASVSSEEPSVEEPTVSEEPSVEEPAVSEEASAEESAAASEEASAEESVVASEEASAEESAASEEASAEESATASEEASAEESKTESKTESEESKADDKEGGKGIIIAIVIAAVAVVAVVAIVLVKNSKKA